MASYSTTKVLCTIAVASQVAVVAVENRFLRNGQLAHAKEKTTGENARKLSIEPGCLIPEQVQSATLDGVTIYDAGDASERPRIFPSTGPVQVTCKPGFAAVDADLICTQPYSGVPELFRSDNVCTGCDLSRLQGIATIGGVNYNDQYHNVLPEGVEGVIECAPGFVTGNYGDTLKCRDYLGIVSQFNGGQCVPDIPCHVPEGLGRIFALTPNLDFGPQITDGLIPPGTQVYAECPPGQENLSAFGNMQIVCNGGDDIVGEVRCGVVQPGCDLDSRVFDRVGSAEVDYFLNNRGLLPYGTTVTEWVCYGDRVPIGDALTCPQQGASGGLVGGCALPGCLLHEGFEKVVDSHEKDLIANNHRILPFGTGWVQFTCADGYNRSGPTYIKCAASNEGSLTFGSGACDLPAPPVAPESISEEISDENEEDSANSAPAATQQPEVESDSANSITATWNRWR